MGPADKPLADSVTEQVAQMQQHIDHHLARARAAGTLRVLGAATDIQLAIDGISRAMVQIHADKQLDLQVEVETGLAAACEREDVDEILGNLIDNACKWARSRVVVRAGRENGTCRLRVEDDGPGIDADHRSIALGRGGRLDETAPGSGLGLSIVSDIVALYGGSVELTVGPLGGLVASVALPASPNP